MSDNTSYRYLREAYLAERCYLFEVLMWRAFGRIPELVFSLDGIDQRFDGEIRDSYTAPVFEDYGLSAEECEFAGIGNDPRNGEENHDYSDLSFYDGIIESFSKHEGITKREDLKGEIENLKCTRKKAEEFHALVAEWMPEYEDYVDEFKSEIFLKLKKGELTAFGTPCSVGGAEHGLDLWEVDSKWPTEDDEQEIPREHWTSSAINWDDSALEGREKAFMWVLVSTRQMLDVFPPISTVPAKELTRIIHHDPNYGLADMA